MTLNIPALLLKTFWGITNMLLVESQTQQFPSKADPSCPSILPPESSQFAPLPRSVSEETFLYLEIPKEPPAAELYNPFKLTIKGQEILDAVVPLFAQMSNLHTLHLRNIYKLPGSIGDLPNLKELTVVRSIKIVDTGERYVSCEEVRSLPESFSKLQNSLEKLSLIGTKGPGNLGTHVSNIPPPQLHGFTKLHTLEMPGNSLQRKTRKLDTKILATLRNLRVLDLSNTGIKQTSFEKNLSEIPVLQSNPYLIQHILESLPSLPEGKEREALVEKFRELLDLKPIPEIQIQELVKKFSLDGKILCLPKELILSVVRNSEELRTNFGSSPDISRLLSYIETLPLQQKQAEALFKQIPEITGKIAEQVEEYPEIEDEIITSAKKIPSFMQSIPELSQPRAPLLEKLERLILDENCIHYLPRTFEDFPSLQTISLVRSPRCLESDTSLARLCEKGITILMGDLRKKYKVLVSENSPLLTTETPLAAFNALFPQIQEERDFEIIRCPNH